MENNKIIVFGPHPDDETLGCGGVIAKKVSEGYNVLVVILTDGRNALSQIFGITSNPTPEELKEIRKKELVKATRILGVPDKNLMCLDFEDSTLEHNKLQVEKSVQAIQHHPFIHVITLETIQREMIVGEKGTRPSFHMLGHTGYLTFARKIAP